MGRVISWARFRNAQSLQLGVTCGDTAAVRMYTALGFEPSGLVEPLRNESPLLAQNMRLILNDRLDSMAYLG